MNNSLTNLNVTNVAEITQEQFIKLANSNLAMPELIILFIFMGLIFLIIGLLLVKKSRGKFLTIWFSSMLLSLIMLLLLIFLPNTIYNLVETIKTWVK